MKPDRRGVTLAVGGCALLAVAAAVLLPLTGAASISLSAAWAGASPDHEILFGVRLPRVLLGLLAGGALALAGVVSQALLRDPLATPYTLGVSSGASLGTVIAICFEWSWTWLAGLAGAGVVVAFVLALATEGRRVSTFTLLLAGVTVNSLCLALILCLQNLATFSQSLVITRWLMGGLDAVPLATLGWLALAIGAVCLFLCVQARDWNLMAVGEEWAAARGVRPQRLALIGYLAISLLTGIVTSFTGPIGFVGLIVPHALRLALGADHRLVLPCSFFLGAVFLAVCDTGARVALAPAEIPVGVVTALLGGPFFLWLLRARRSWRP